MPVKESLDLLARGMGLRPQDLAMIIRVGWVIIVSAHMLWVCGLLAWAGIDIPFARASDFSKLEQGVAVSARLQLGKEIRGQMLARCVANSATIDSIEQYIDRLQGEYESITGKRYPEVECPKKD